MPRSAISENQAMLPWPKGTTISAASSGPSAEPTLPPTWKSDCAKPCRPPEASRATREDSGWKTAEPRPTSAAPSTSTGKLGAPGKHEQAAQREAHAGGQRKGQGRRSV